MRVTGWVTPLRKGAIIYFVVFDRRGIAGAWSRKESISTFPCPPSLEAASSTPNLSLPLLCSGSVASTADSRNVRCRANCSSTPDPAPPHASVAAKLAHLALPNNHHPCTPDVQPGAAEYHCNRVQLSPPPLPPSIIPLEFEVALHACWRSFLRCSPPQLVDSSGFFLFFWKFFGNFWFPFLLRVICCPSFQDPAHISRLYLSRSERG